MQPVLPTAYLPPLTWWALALAGNGAIIEQHENYPRQTYRNRCEIYSGNGLLTLSIPVKKVTGNHTLITEIRIDYSTQWQRVHWRSLESAYMKTPYFPFYADDLHDLLMQKSERLVDFNRQLMHYLLRALNLTGITLNETVSYDKQVPQPDFRLFLSPKHNPGSYGFTFFPRYIQAFEQVSGFLPNLSIIDLLANEGPSSPEILYQIRHQAMKDVPGPQPGIQS